MTSVTCSHGLGKLLYGKGESAEERSIPKLFSGPVQKMYRTVTEIVESYRHLLGTIMPWVLCVLMAFFRE